MYTNTASLLNFASEHKSRYRKYYELVYLNFLAGHFHGADHTSILPALTVSSPCSLHATTQSVLSICEESVSDFLSDEVFQVSSKYGYAFYEMEIIKRVNSTDYYIYIYIYYI